MKREIKFRFFSPDKRMLEEHDGWVEGIGINEALHHSGNYGYKIMQFTGLIDKNGKEIYEGDIYQVAGNKVYQVKYIDKQQVQSGGYETYGACFVLYASDELFFPFDEYAMEHGKVIGNIYENPELL